MRVHDHARRPVIWVCLVTNPRSPTARRPACATLKVPLAQAWADNPTAKRAVCLFAEAGYQPTLSSTCAVRSLSRRDPPPVAPRRLLPLSGATGTPTPPPTGADAADVAWLEGWLAGAAVGWPLAPMRSSLAATACGVSSVSTCSASAAVGRSLGSALWATGTGVTSRVGQGSAHEPAQAPHPTPPASPRAGTTRRTSSSGR